MESKIVVVLTIEFPLKISAAIREQSDDKVVVGTQAIYRATLKVTDQVITCMTHIHSREHTKRLLQHSIQRHKNRANIILGTFSKEILTKSIVLNIIRLLRATFEAKTKQTLCMRKFWLCVFSEN